MGLDVSNQRDCPVNNVGFNIESFLLFLFCSYDLFTWKNLQLIYQAKISGEMQLKFKVIATFLYFLQITLVHEVLKCFSENS